MAYRCFHEITVCFATPTRRTISLVPTPSAASNTIRARAANSARIDGDRSQPSSTSRSAGGTANSQRHDASFRTTTPKSSYIANATLELVDYGYGFRNN